MSSSNTQQHLAGSGSFQAGGNMSFGAVHLPGPAAPEPPVRRAYHLSPSTHETFIGRKALVKDLLKELKPGKKGVIQQARAVHADGGVGKTSLATRVGWQLFEKKTFDYVLFLAATDPNDLQLEISSLCERDWLNLPAQACQEQEPRYREVLAFLKQEAVSRRTLLILDGADGEEARTFVHELRRELSGCSFLITSRHADWGKGVQGVSLDLFSPEEALEFLHDRLVSNDSSSSDDTLRDIAEAVDNLPLALEIVASYIKDAHLPPARWLEEWRSTPAPTLLHHNPDHLEYPVSLARVWELSVTRLPDSARMLLHMLAWIAPRPVVLPLTLFEKLQGWAQMRDDLSILAKASLVGWEDEPPRLLIHRLLQTCMRCAFTTKDAQASLIASILLLAEVLPSPEWSRDGWPIWEALSPHLRSLFAATQKETTSQELAGLLSTVIGDYGSWLYYRAQHAEAEDLMRRSLQISEKVYGPDHPEVASSLNNLALLLKATNRLSEAEDLMRRALEITEKSFGQDHPLVASSLNNLALLFQATNRLVEAEEPTRRALQITEKNCAPDHPQVAIRLNNLALLLQSTNRLPQAEDLMRRALEITEKSYGPNHPQTAITLNNLAQLLQATNRLTEAEEPMRRALQITEKIYGPDHPQVAIRLNNLAALLQFTNRLTEAEDLVRRALQITEKSYGLDHPQVAIVLNSLAALLKSTNRLVDAGGPMRRHLVIFAKFTAKTGHSHPHLEDAMNNYLSLLVASGQSETDAFPNIVSALVEGGMSQEQMKRLFGVSG